MLHRYRKPGGLIQLLQLIESSEPAKRQNLIELIAAEDPGWAHLVKVKALSVERIMSWPLETLLEIAPNLSPNHCEILYYCCPEEHRKKWMDAVSPQVKRKLQSGEIPPDITHMASVSLKLIQLVRDLEQSGMINLAEVDSLVACDSRMAA